MEYRRLGDTNMEVSMLGFGASSLGGVFHEVNFDECAETVRNALEGGINFIDVAPAYGETLAELNLGKALDGNFNYTRGRHEYRAPIRGSSL